MRKEDFSSTAAVTVMQHLGRGRPDGYWAAHPNPLPPALEPKWPLFQSLSEANSALSELAGLARTLPNPDLLIGPFMRKEAVLSSKIEGTQASLSDLLLFEASGGSEQRTSDVRQVSDYVRALTYALEHVATFPISLRLFRDIHKIFVRDPTKTPGEFRTSQNWIGPDGCTLHEASYVPPPPEAMLECLNDLEKYLHVKGTLPALIKYAVVHYQFEAIHPFLDGNGRLGRLLISLLLCADPTLEYTLLPKPLLYLSAYFERNRGLYYERLDSVSKRGEWDQWLIYFLEAVTTQSRDAITKSDRLLQLRQSLLNKVHEHRCSALVHQIVEQLFISPVLSVPLVVQLFGRTFTGSQHAVKKLMALQILSEVPSQNARLYIAWDVLHAIEE